jgi:antitoxin (DNA-binding transcriptional repressor) of toxin-antitoxin stability system
MKTAGVREVKDRFSEFLRMVKGGEEILITDRGEVIAKLGPPGSAIGDSEYPQLEALIRQGRVSRGAPNRPDLYTSPRHGSISREELQRLIDAEREDR